MLKIEKNSHPFGLPEVNNMMKNAKEIGFKQKVTKGNATFEFRESGHVIGGSTGWWNQRKNVSSIRAISKQMVQECYEKWIWILEKLIY